jgi:hypothetical protein
LTVGHSVAITEKIAESRSIPSSPGAQDGEKLRSNALESGTEPLYRLT